MSRETKIILAALLFTAACASLNYSRFGNLLFSIGALVMVSAATGGSNVTMRRPWRIASISFGLVFLLILGFTLFLGNYKSFNDILLESHIIFPFWLFLMVGCFGWLISVRDSRHRLKSE